MKFLPSTSASATTKLLVALLVLLAGALGYLLWQTHLMPPERYHAVLLTSGDLYFGKLHRFPTLSLTDVYFLERNPGDPQAPFRLTRLTDAVWGPGDRLELNRESVIWVNRLPDESPVARAIEAARLGRVPQPATEPTTSTPSGSSPEPR